MEKHPFNLEEIQKHALSVRAYYNEQPFADKINILNVGKPGTGKTGLLITAPKPVLEHSFDRGGTKTAMLKSFIERGEIICDTRFEQDSWKDPKAFRLWETVINDLQKIGFFDALGTYCLDSATTFAESMMYAIIKTGGKKNISRIGQLPELQDYHAQQYIMVDYLNVLMSLPCHVIVNGHLTFIKDEVTGGINTGILLAGKASDKVPLVFDEKYISRIHNKKFVLQTRSDGYYHAETRVGGLTFSPFEEQNLYKLLEKAGLPFADKKPISNLVQKEVSK